MHSIGQSSGQQRRENGVVTGASRRGAGLLTLSRNADRRVSGFGFDIDEVPVDLVLPRSQTIDIGRIPYQSGRRGRMVVEQRCDMPRNLFGAEIGIFRKQYLDGISYFFQLYVCRLVIA